MAFTPRPTPEELEAFYNNGYHDRFSESAMANMHFAQNRYQFLENMLHRYAPKLAVQTGRKLLDVGCGTGDFLQVAQQAGWHVTGTELAKDAVDRASQKVGNHILQGDMTEIYVPDGSYHLVTSYHVIEHLLDPIAQLKRCYDLLIPGGLLFVETPNIQSLGARLKGKNWSHIIPPEHILYFSPVSLRHALHRAGFDQIVVGTSAPQIVESIVHWPWALKKLAGFIYQIAPRVGLGAAVQALAFKQ
ncbi:class I SAM-dependent methyltransferase [Leptolyngbya sp. Heron Island J]|uniref:class I SAM-dependent methyltransferase n=1 Tax=Leptolyngbya sp. Heron Island J TaxID=1385935 RepID=UPI001F1B479B|nr:class I SAM-dependent methyltransferase [Leptolyngbya sp. Heron Island J]